MAMITFAEYVVHKRHTLYFSHEDTIESLTLLIVQKTDELKNMNPRYVKKIAQLKLEIAELKIQLKELIAKKRLASSKLTFKQLIALDDSYDKLLALQKKVQKYTGDTSAKWYKLALEEIERLESIKPELIKKRKQDLTEKWKNRESEIQGDSDQLVSYDLTQINEEIQKMYMLFTDSKEFMKQAKKVKKVLQILLPALKNRTSDKEKHLFRKYYSVWIDINELLDESRI